MFNLSSSMVDRIRFDEMLYCLIDDYKSNLEAEGDAEDVELADFDDFYFDDDFQVDDTEEARARALAQWERVFCPKKPKVGMKQEYNQQDGTVIVTATYKELALWYHNGLDLYHTPGASQVYVASKPSFMYDKVVATVEDFEDEAGYEVDFSDDVTEEEKEEEFILTISLG